MNFQDFTKTIQEQIKDYLPKQYEDAEVGIITTEKNNGLVLTGLGIRNEDENVSPCIYLNGYYEELQAGKEMDNILKDIAACRVENAVIEKMDVNDLTTFEKVKDKITFKVIGTESNEMRLSQMPHRTENDMALIYQITVHMDSAGQGNIPITNSLMEVLGVNEEILHDLALENTMREMPASFRSMKDVMREMFVGNISMIQEDDEMQDFLNEMLSDDSEISDDEMQMYVLSNSEKLNGAAALFYPGIKEQIAEQLDNDFFLLPSSIHETLIIPDNGMADEKSLQNMVQEVNATEVAPDEVLTGNVYFYDKESKVFSLAKDREVRKAEQKEEKPSIMNKLKESKDKVAENIEHRTPASNKALVPEM